MQTEKSCDLSTHTIIYVLFFDFYLHQVVTSHADSVGYNCPAFEIKHETMEENEKKSPVVQLIQIQLSIYEKKELEWHSVKHILVQKRNSPFEFNRA